MGLPVVLYINHRNPSCGVHQFGRKLYDQLVKTPNYTLYYIDIDRKDEQDYWISTLNPDIIVWNFYTNATMPWMSPAVVREQRARYKRTACIFHEVPIDYMGFDVVFHQDPTVERTGNIFPLARPIPEFDHSRVVSRGDGIPVFGSFGFGLGGKGFDRIVERVCQEYDEAIVRLSIPYAAFGDAQGYGARSWVDSARARITKPGVHLEVTHDLMPEPVLLDWLFANDVNCFFYDENYGRGLTGTLDYALAVRRPIAITQSYQFKHIWPYAEECNINVRTLRQIETGGIAHLEQFHAAWGDGAVARSFELGFNYMMEMTLHAI